MTSPIDPIRRTERVRRTKRPQVEGSTEAAEETAGLPVPVRSAPPPALKPAAPVAAQLLGETERRGLRGGEPVIKAANSAYARTEWSGSADRRAPKGKHAKTEI